jgi:hypothetical protein
MQWLRDSWRHSQHLSEMAAPIESVNPDTLLSLLDLHTDIDPASLAALSCTSTTYNEAVDRMWPKLMTRYASKCDSGTVEHKPPVRFNETLYEEEELDRCCDYHIHPSGKPSVFFEFSDVGWNRNSAFMPVRVARKQYFLTTKDIRILPSLRNSRGGWYYRFTDVIEAAVLRHGRAVLVEKMWAKMQKQRQRWARRLQRRAAAQALANQALPEVLLTQHYVERYCRDFYSTGRGGLQAVKQLFYNHQYFSYKVIFDTVRGPLAPLRGLVEHGSHLTAAEQQRVSHLQIAYVLTLEKRCIEDAVRVVCLMLLGHTP